MELVKTDRPEADTLQPSRAPFRQHGRPGRQAIRTASRQATVGTTPCQRSMCVYPAQTETVDQPADKGTQLPAD